MTTISTPTAFSSALIAGGLAGTAVDTLFFPIDTLKTRAQSHAGFFPSGGFSGVYRGLGSAVVGSAPGGKDLSLIDVDMNLIMTSLKSEWTNSGCILYEL